MRVSSLGVARPAYYDRNGVSLTYEYTSYGIGPHVETVRWTYTVPSGKKAYVEVLHLEVYRVTVAAPVNRYASAAFVTPVSGSGVKLTEASSYSNVVDAAQRVVYGGSMLLYAGDQLMATTLDASTGGTIVVRAASKLSQFDA